MQIRQITKEDTDKTTISVVDTDSQSIEGAQVLLIAKNNTYFDSKTDKDGRVIFTKLPIKSYSVFIAHPDYPAYVVEGYALSKDLVITLKKADGFSSLVIPNSTGHIPDLEGRLNPILDTSDRTYLYADNIAIEGGKNQPVTFVIGEPIVLEDRNGTSMSVTFIRVQGDSSLLQYKKFSTAENVPSNLNDSEALSLHMTTAKSAESRVVDLDKSKATVSSFGNIERMTNNQTFAVVVGGLLLLIAIFLIYRFGGIDLNNPKPENIQAVTQTSVVTKENKIPVTGSNHSEEGFNLKVPRGNSSSCVWTWVAGTGDIPESQTTDSTSDASNLHKLPADFFNGKDFKVGCTNDYGEYYEGQFSV